MSNRKRYLYLAVALACGVYPADANEQEDVFIPAPLPVFIQAREPLPPLTVHEGVVLQLAQNGLPPGAPPAAPAPAPSKRRKGEDSVHLGFGGSAPSRSLVIPRDDMDPQTLASTQEDLNVMAVILDQAVDHKSSDERKVMGIDIFGGSSSSSARNLFLEGYGALFILKTKLTLTPPSTEKKEETKAKEPENSEWEDARRRLYGPTEWERQLQKTFKHLPGGPPPPYDEGEVTELKNNIINSLKNATNIRGLKGDNTVTVVVHGSGGESGQDMFTMRLHAIVNGGGPEPERRIVTGDKTTEVRRGSTMIIQAKKGDIDDFAKNGNQESFRKKVKVRVQ